MKELTPDVAAQYRAVREGAGLLDRSGVGKILLTGADRFTWLQGMVSNDMRLLEGKAARLPAFILDATGHILADVTLMRSQGTIALILMDLPRVCVPKIMTLLDRLLIMEEVELKDATEDLACFSYQGPAAQKAFRIAQQQFGDLLTDWAQMDGLEVEADHTGSGGRDAYFPRKEAAALQEDFTRRGGVTIGAEAEEILRVEAGLPKYGVELDETVLAPEAGLSATHISLTKGCYVGQEVVARIDSRGHTNRALTGLVILEGPVPASGDKLYFGASAAESRETGRITSAIAASPAMGGRPIALGYVRHEHRDPGTRLTMTGEALTGIAEVVDLPFYRRPEA